MKNMKRTEFKSIFFSWFKPLRENKVQFLCIGLIWLVSINTFPPKLKKFLSFLSAKSLTSKNLSFFKFFNFYLKVFHTHKYRNIIYDCKKMASLDLQGCKNCLFHMTFNTYSMYWLGIYKEWRCKKS